MSLNLILMKSKNAHVQIQSKPQAALAAGRPYKQHYSCLNRNDKCTVLSSQPQRHLVISREVGEVKEGGRPRKPAALPRIQRTSTLAVKKWVVKLQHRHAAHFLPAPSKSYWHHRSGTTTTYLNCQTLIKAGVAQRFGIATWTSSTTCGPNSQEQHQRQPSPSCHPAASEPRR